MRIYCIIFILWCSALQLAYASEGIKESQPLPQPQPVRARKAIRCYCRQNEFSPNITVCNKLAVAASAWYMRFIDYETDEKAFASYAESTAEMIKPGESITMHAYSPSIVPFAGICLCKKTNITKITACTFYLCIQALDGHRISPKQINEQSNNIINLVPEKNGISHPTTLDEDIIEFPQS